MLQKPMFLAGVERNPEPGLHRDVLRAAQAAEDRVAANLASIRVPAASHRALGLIYSGDHAWRCPHLSGPARVDRGF